MRSDNVVENWRGCASQKLISHSIMPPTVRNGDLGHRLLEVVLPFQGLVTAPIATQDYPFPTIDVRASDEIVEIARQNSFQMTIF
jgi:hypothetical protein